MDDTPGLGLRFLACDGCGTVFALPDRPAACDRCDGRLRELRDLRGPDAYFVP